MNLPELIKQHFAGGTTLNLSDAISEPPQRVSEAVACGVPLLLASISRRASRQAGADELMALTQAQDPSLLDSFSDMVQNGQIHSLIERGSRSLASLLGQGGFDALAGAISRHSRMTVASSRSVVSMMMPVTLAVLARHSKASTGAELSQFLAGQAGNITRAIEGYENGLEEPRLEDHEPAETGNTVAATSFDDAMHGESEFPRQEMVMAEHGSDAQIDSRSKRAWAGPVLATSLVAIAVAWMMWSRQSNTAAPVVRQNTPPQVGVAPQAIGQSVIPGVDANAQVAGSSLPDGQRQPAGLLPAESLRNALGNTANSPAGRELSEAYGQLWNVLAGVQDEASARAAGPQLQEISRRFDQVPRLLTNLPQNEQTRVRSAMQQASAGIAAGWQKLSSIPGAQEHLKQPLDQIQQKLSGTGAPQR
jgi:Bacterial protein of unknown function (DUF937)